jgi:hypothetical protein
MVAPGGSVGVPTVVTLRSNAESGCEIAASQRGQSPLNTKIEGPTALGL